MPTRKFQELLHEMPAARRKKIAKRVERALKRAATRPISTGTIGPAPKPLRVRSYRRHRQEHALMSSAVRCG